MQMIIRKGERTETKKSQFLFIKIAAYNAHHYSEPTAGSISISALNDDRYFPAVLFFLPPSLHIDIKLTKNNL
jgi:hypothetical protein